MLKCSLLISTYNWPLALQSCLLSVARQSELPDEIIICDDGSGPETKELIALFKKQLDIPVVHIWQPDEGFQLSRIRNKGIAAAKSEYIIQIDGDLVLHRHFIKDHLAFRKKESFTTGSRVFLSQDSTGEIFKTKNVSINVFWKGNRNFFNGLRIPFLQNFLSRRYKNKGDYKYYVKGCNMAFWKKDLLLVNGYNEDFTGWGREDSEIAIRLMNSGIQKRFLKFGGICYHLYHKEISRQMEERNSRMMKEAIEKKTTRAIKGLSQYL